MLSVNPNPTISAVAAIQLETTSFTVNEEVGSVEVCVNLLTSDEECPVEFDVRVNLSSRAVTAGTGI